MNAFCPLHAIFYNKPNHDVTSLMTLFIRDFAIETGITLLYFFFDAYFFLLLLPVLLLLLLLLLLFIIIILRELYGGTSNSFR